jgi:hypothetical protein
VDTLKPTCYLLPDLSLSIATVAKSSKRVPSPGKEGAAEAAADRRRQQFQDTRRALDPIEEEAMAAGGSTSGGDTDLSAILVKLDAKLETNLLAVKAEFTGLRADLNTEFTAVKEAIADNHAKTAVLTQRVDIVETKVAAIVRKVLGVHSDVDPNQLSMYVDPQQLDTDDKFTALDAKFKATLASKRMSISFSMRKAGPLPEGKKPFQRDGKNLQLYHVVIPGGERDRVAFAATIGPILRGMGGALLDVLTKEGKDLKLARMPVKEYWSKQPGVTACTWAGARIRINQGGVRKFLSSYELPAAAVAPA